MSRESGKSAAKAIPIALLGFFCLEPAAAEESNRVPYAPGASQFFGGLIPPVPGLFMLSQTSYYSADRLNDGDGNKASIDFKVNAVAETFRFLYVPGGGMLRWQYFAQLVVPIVYSDIALGIPTPFGKVHLSDEDASIADLTITPFGLAWRLDKWHIAAGIDIVAPTGPYNSGRLLNIGLNYWSLQPTVGIKYFDPKGLDVSIVPRLMINATNHDTNYHSGTGLVTDFAVGWNFGLLGVTGYDYRQIEDDKQNGLKVADGNRGAAFGIGPAAMYSFSPGTTLSASWQRELYAENMPQGSTFWLNFSTKLD